MRRVPRRRVAQLLIGCLISAALADHSVAAPRTWIGNDLNWVDNGSVANWTPADEPDADDEAIFNTANSVDLGSSNSIQALTLSNGIDLNTNLFDLTVDGLVQLSNANTNLIITGSTSTLTADSVTINSGAKLQFVGGLLQVVEETGNGLLDINAGGTLSGYGAITLNDSLAAPTVLLTNDGTISASRTAINPFLPPDAGTLSIGTVDVDGLIDLDGGSGNGVVNVFRNQTLQVNGKLFDSFSGDINLYHNSTLNMSDDWTLDVGTINIHNGFVEGGFFPDTPADKSIIAGSGTLEQQAGSTITVADADGTLQFDGDFLMSGGTLTNNGLVIFNADAQINSGANFVMAGSQASLTVEPGRNVLINQTNFNLDGAGSITNQITVNGGGNLTINVTDYDTDVGANAFDGIITLNSGHIHVTTGDAEFVMDGTLNMNRTTGSVAFWDGESLDVGDNIGVNDAHVNVGGVGVSNIDSQTDFNADANVNIAAGAILSFNTAATVNFNTVNGVNNAKFTGTGEISFSGTVNVNEAVHLNMVGGTVDLDGNDSVGEFINIDNPLTIHAATLRNFGRVNGGGGVNTLDIENDFGTGILTVNLDSPASEWTLNAQGVMNLTNDDNQSILLAGSAVNLNGTVNVIGDVQTTARVDIGFSGTVNIKTAGQPFDLGGGDGLASPNTIIGGTINGPGILSTSNALHGFGTINALISFAGGNLRADNATLTVNSTISSVNTIGTADSDGILNVVNPWNTNVATNVELMGGVLQGGAITIGNANGVKGHGLVSARVINNTKLTGTLNTLVVETAANDNDWDGTTNTGQLRAESSGTLELRDNLPFGFTGSVIATAHSKVYTNGFALDFNPGSTIALLSGKYQSTHPTNIGGAVVISSGVESTIEVADNQFVLFEPTSSTTLNGSLRLVNNDININAGATFSGAGSLIVPENSHLAADPNANINVILDNQGVFRPGGFDAVGQVNVKSYQQGSTGKIFVELAGTAPNQYDQVVVGGTASLTGLLVVDLDGGFMPSTGSSFTILTAAGGRSGTFSSYDLPSIGAANSLAIAYGANDVTLHVIAGLWGDYNGNGVVDAADYIVWRDTLGSALAAFSGADGNGNGLVDQSDYDLWKSRFGLVLGSGVGSIAAVPEPASITLLALGLLAGAVPRRRPKRASAARCARSAGTPFWPARLAPG